ncbi:MAG: DUF2026 family protein [Pseudoruegeria sp.]
MTEGKTITEYDFNLLSTAIQGLLLKTSFAKSQEEYSVLFSILGAVIMKGKLGIPCRPVVGDWYIHHPNGEIVLGIGKVIGKPAEPKSAGFHAWIQTETHIIDLMSPMYPEIFSAANSLSPVPRKMLQVPRTDDAKNWEEFQQGVPLMANPNVELSKTLLGEVANDQDCEGLAGALLHWWPKLIADSKAILAFYPVRGDGLAIAHTGHKAVGGWQGPKVIKKAMQ